MRPHGAPHGRKMTSKFRVGSLPEEQPSQRRVCLPTQTGRSPHARYPQGRRRGLWLRTSQRGLNPPRSREGSPSPPWGVPPPPPTPWTWGIPPGAPRWGLEATSLVPRGLPEKAAFRAIHRSNPLSRVRPVGVPPGPSLAPTEAGLDGVEEMEITLADGHHAGCLACAGEGKPADHPLFQRQR